MISSTPVVYTRFGRISSILALDSGELARLLNMYACLSEVLGPSAGCDVHAALLRLVPERRELDRPRHVPWLSFVSVLRASVLSINASAAACSRSVRSTGSVGGRGARNGARRRTP